MTADAAPTTSIKTNLSMRLLMHILSYLGIDMLLLPARAPAAAAGGARRHSPVSAGHGCVHHGVHRGDPQEGRPGGGDT